MKNSDITEISSAGGNVYTMDDLGSGSEPTLDRENGLRERKHMRDKEDLARFGKRQQLRRNFGLLSTVGLTCTLMVTWEGFTTTFTGGLTNGGPVGLVYGFLFVWIGTFLQALVMSEMASMIPLAGGQYNWVSILSPPSCSRFLSYLTGWMTVISWQAVLASGSFLGATIIQGLLILNYPTYSPQRWHATLLFYAIIAVCLFTNTYLARILPQIEATVLLLHILGFFGILIPLVYLAPQSSPSAVFTAFNNGGGWSTDGISFFVGLSTSIFSFIGLDAASHMAEEIENASKIIPRSMCTSVLLNGLLGFAMCIALLFSLGDIETALNSPTGLPFIQIYTDTTRSSAAGTGMACIVLGAVIIAGLGCMATASRMTWAFAREKGLPGSKYLARVEPITSLPLYSIGLSTLTSLFLALINIGSTTAFNALISLVVASFYSSFAIAATVMLHKRLTTPASELIWGPFRLGRAGVPITVLALIFTTIGIFFSFWPANVTVTAQTMNWSVTVYGGVLILSLVFWVTHGRKVYKGPIMEITNRANSDLVISSRRDNMGSV